MDKKVKNIIFKSSFIGLISIIILSYIVSAVRKIIKINESKLMMIFANLLAKPLYKKQKEIINEILDISIMIDKIYEINISSGYGNYKKVKNYDVSNSQNYSYKIKYKNKNAGLLNVVFEK